MYKVVQGIVEIEGEHYVTFGLSFDDVIVVPDISSNKQNVERLAELFNKEKVDVTEVELFIEEFLAEGI